MKKLFLFLVLAIVLAGGAFAQNGQGFIKPTLGLGYFMGTGDMDEIKGVMLSADVDFVHSSGFTLGFGNWHLNETQDNGGNSSIAGAGLGYTYATDAWCAGGKLLMSLSSVALLGINANFSYWLIDNLGLGGMINLLFSLDDDISGSIFSIGVGVSLKF